MQATNVDTNSLRVISDDPVKSKSITIDNIELPFVVFDEETSRQAQAVNNALMHIKLIPDQLEAHILRMSESLRSMLYYYYSRPEDEEAQANRVMNVKRHLSQFLAWYNEAMESVFYSEYTFEQRAGRKLWGYRIKTAKKCEELFKETARVIDQLQHPRANPYDALDMRPFRGTLPSPVAFSDRELERVLAEHSVYLAYMTACALGPIGDRRYRHRDKPKWARIRARSFEHLRILVQKDIADKIGGDGAVQQNKQLSARLKKAALALRALAATGEVEKLEFAAEEAEYERQLEEAQHRRASQCRSSGLDA